MARKPTVDVDKVAQMLREGQSTKAVAEYFGVSRQAIDLHRRKFIQGGQLDVKRPPRVDLRPDDISVGSAKPPREEQVVSLDRLIELMIQAFDSLKKLPQMEAELVKTREDYRKAAAQIEQLEKEVSRRREQEARWQVTISPQESSHVSNNPIQ